MTGDLVQLELPPLGHVFPQIADADGGNHVPAHEPQAQGQGAAHIPQGQEMNAVLLFSERGFQGMFCVVSDPVDPLCRAALLESGLSAGQIRCHSPRRQASRLRAPEDRAGAT